MRSRSATTTSMQLAATVWTLIQHPMTLKELAEAVADRFGLEKDVAERDVEQLLHRMTIEGLVEVEQD